MNTAKFSIYTDLAFQADTNPLKTAIGAVSRLGKSISGVGKGLKSLPKSPFSSFAAGLQSVFVKPFLSTPKQKSSVKEKVTEKVIEKKHQIMGFMTPSAVEATRPIAQTATSAAANAAGLAAIGATIARSLSPLLLVLTGLGATLGLAGKTFGWSQSRAEERQQERVRAQGLGVSVPILLGLEKSAQKAGVFDGKGAIEQALGAIQGMQESLKLGQPSQAAHILSSRGVNLFNKDHEPRQVKELLLDALEQARKAPQQNQNLILKQLFGSDQLAPLLERPAEDMREDLKESEKHFETREKQAALFESVAVIKEKTEALSRQMDGVGEALNGLQSKVLNKISSALGGVVSLSQKMRNISPENADLKEEKKGLGQKIKDRSQSNETKPRAELSPRQVPVSERLKPEKKSVIEIAFTGLPQGATAGVKTESEGLRLNLGSMLETFS